MKSSYKIALLVAAVLVVFGLGYALMQNDSSPRIEDADGPAPSGEARDTVARRAPTRTGDAQTGSRPSSTPTPATSDAADTDADGSTAADTSDSDTSSAPTNPLLAELRASLQAAQNRPGAAPTAGPDATDVAEPDPTLGTGPATDAATRAAANDTPDDADADADADRDTTIRANDTLAIESPSRPSSGDTDGPETSAVNAGSTSTVARANVASPSTTAAPEVLTVGPEPGQPYFGPLPESMTNRSSARRETSADRRPTPASAATGSTPATYEIKAGDTFASIAIALYGDERRWVDIAQANPMVDPTKLRIGQEIRLPGADSPRRRDAAETASGRDGRTVPYVIRPSDTLSTIAQQFYGNPGQWRLIFDANRDVLGDNPDRIRAGVEIDIPPAPRGAQ